MNMRFHGMAEEMVAMLKLNKASAGRSITKNASGQVSSLVVVVRGAEHCRDAMEAIKALEEKWDAKAFRKESAENPELLIEAEDEEEGDDEILSVEV